MTTATAEPIHDLDTEAAVLGAVLRGESLPDGLRGEHFYRVEYGLIFDAALAVAEAGDPVDELGVVRWLDDRGQLKAVGGARAVNVIADTLPDLVNLEHHALYVIEDSRKREAAKLGARLQQGDDLEVVLPKLEELAAQRPGRGGFGFQSVELTEFLEMDLPERVRLLGEFLHEGDLCEVHAKRGGAKTMVSLGMGVAVTAGAPFLRWGAGERPAGVLYVDGEMPARTMQDRLAMMVRAIGKPLAPLLLVTPDLQESGMRSLNDPTAQAALERILDQHNEVRLVILDNLSALCGGAENDAESWQPMQDFILRLRRRGLAVLFDHHSGKAGAQRGTSKREDVLDVVINLREPANYHPSEGARFEVHFEKARGIRGDAVHPFEASLVDGPDGLPTWAVKTLDDSRMEEVAKLVREGVSQKDIATDLGIHKSNVSRAVCRARAHGLLADSGGAK